MSSLVKKWIILTVAVLAAALITSSLGLGMSVNLSSPAQVPGLFIASAVLAILNASLGKVLKFIATPLRCLTLGLFSIVINGAILWWVGTMGFGLKVDGLIPAMVGSIIISVTNGILYNLFKGSDKDDDE